MSRPARAMMPFAIYSVVVGLSFVAWPGCLVLMRLPALDDGWARIVGFLAIANGSYEIAGALAESIPFIRASVYVRYGFAVGVVVLVAAGQLPLTGLLFALVDAAGASWAALALRETASKAA